MMRRSSHPAERATDREVGVVAAVLVTGSEKAAAAAQEIRRAAMRPAASGGRIVEPVTEEDVWCAA
jgi:hypothetical protein